MTHAPAEWPIPTTLLPWIKSDFNSVCTARPHSYAAANKVKDWQKLDDEMRTNSIWASHEHLLVDNRCTAMIGSVRNPRFGDDKGIVGRSLL